MFSFLVAFVWVLIKALLIMCVVGFVGLAFFVALIFIVGWFIECSDKKEKKK